MATIVRKPLQLTSSVYSADWDVPRSAGLHLMQIVDFMEEERAALIGEKVNKGADATALEAYRFGGFMLEHIMAHHIIEVECQRSPALIRPGEVFWCHSCREAKLQYDPSRDSCLRKGHRGIFATPDALRTDTMRLKEWKCTWKSLSRAAGDNDDMTDGEFADHLVEGIWKWPVQTKAYCYLLGVTEADQEVLFINGNWRPPVPQVMRYEMTFTEQELKLNWDYIVATAEREGWL